jgi:hypothetical protein
VSITGQWTTDACGYASIISYIWEQKTRTSARHCAPPLGGVAIQGNRTDAGAAPLDCFVATAPRNDGEGAAQGNRVKREPAT